MTIYTDPISQVYELLAQGPLQEVIYFSFQVPDKPLGDD